MDHSEGGSSDSLIEITGPTAALEAGVATGIPVKAGVPSFDREWCPEEDSNLHAVTSAAT
jgi:site-specific DNA recombinase